MSESKENPLLKVKASVSQPALPGKKNVKQRWMLVGVGATGVFLFAVTFMTGGPSSQNKPQQAMKKFEVAPVAAERRSFEAATGRDLQALQQTVQGLAESNKRLTEAMAAMQANGLKAATAAPQPTAAPRSLGQVLMDDSPLAPPRPPSAGGTTGPAGNPSDGNAAALGGLIAPPKPPASLLPQEKASTGSGGMSNKPSSPAAPMSFSPPAESDSNQPVSYKPTAATSGAGDKPVAVTRDYQKNPNAGSLLPSFAPVALLHGVDAEGGQGGQTMPVPVFLRIQDNAILPGSAKYELKSCTLLGSGSANMSMQRALFRIANISCLDKNNRMVLDQPVKGYLVDSDSSLGLRGKVEDRQGAKLWRSTLAGFAQGLSGAFGSNNTSVLGALTGTGGMTTGQTLQSSAWNGANSAANQIAQFYLQEAQSIFPIISIEPGRQATVVFTEKTSLNWLVTDGLYTETVTPQKKK